MALKDDVKITRVLDAVATGSTTVYGYSVDMQNGGNAVDGCDFFCLCGDYTAVELFAQGSADNTTFYNLAGSGTDFTADTYGYSVGVLSVTLPKTTHRYIRPGVIREDAVIDGILAIQYGSDRKPVTNDADGFEAENEVITPAAGAI